MEKRNQDLIGINKPSSADPVQTTRLVLHKLDWKGDVKKLNKQELEWSDSRNWK